MPRRRRRSLKLNLATDTIFSISAVSLLLASALTFVSFFAQAASANSAIQIYLNKFFGWGVILVPPVLAVGGLVMIRRIKWRFINLNTLLGLILLLVSFTGLVHLILYNPTIAYQKAVAGSGGGLIGFKVQQILRGSFSTPGAFLILIGIGVVALIITFNASIDRVFMTIGDTVSAVWRIFNESVAPFFAQIFNRALHRSEEVVEIENTTPLEIAAPTVKPEFEVVTAIAEPGRSAKPSNPSEKPKNLLTTPTPLPMVSHVWEYPPLDLLSDVADTSAQRGDVKASAQIIEQTLGSFGIQSRVVEINLGPSVTQYALESAQGTKIAKITNLQNDLAMALASPTGSVRIEAPIPGKSLIGIEVPNYAPALVTLKGIMKSDQINQAHSKLTVALGLNVAGAPVIADISKMPHVLVAGATGSGKSVLLHSFIATLLFRASPYEVKLILIDPKRVELTRYNNIPHLLTHVITDPEKAVPAMKWVVSEMDRRYRLFEEAGTRDINAYNELSGFQALPYIIVLVDELADLMTMAPIEVEKTITRLAQMSRATGIHLILATQRPSVDVLTGLIKANIPTRIAFNVASQVDSRVILDQIGAEKLLGRGDMLYVPPDASKPMRIQGVYVSEEEIGRLVEFIRAAPVETEYKEEVTEYVASKAEVGKGVPEDEFFNEAVRIVCEYDRASASLLQRRLRIGYARAARLLDELEERGIVGSAEGSKPRDVLIHDPEIALGSKE